MTALVANADHAGAFLLIVGMLALTVWGGIHIRRIIVAATTAEDASYEAMRTPGMGDPIYTRLAQERPDVAARLEASALDDDERVAAWLRGAS